MWNDREIERERERWSNTGDREERIMHALETMRSERAREREIEDG